MLIEHHFRITRQARESLDEVSQRMGGNSLGVASEIVEQVASAARLLPACIGQRKIKMSKWRQRLKSEIHVRIAPDTSDFVADYAVKYGYRSAGEVLRDFLVIGLRALRRKGDLSYREVHLFLTKGRDGLAA